MCGSFPIERDRPICAPEDKVCRTAQGVPGRDFRHACRRLSREASGAGKISLSAFSRLQSSSGPELALGPRRKAVTLAQRIVEMLIGRLITDEMVRSDFLADPENTLLALSDLGLELSRTEIAALVNTDSTLWARTADELDPRLQKASFKNETRLQ